MIYSQEIVLLPPISKSEDTKLAVQLRARKPSAMAVLDMCVHARVCQSTRTVAAFRTLHDSASPWCQLVM
jgi:hypothetical protein